MLGCEKMKLKGSYFFTIRENIKDEGSVSGNLLVKSGMIKKVSAGVYMFLPLGLIVLRKIEKIIREEMNKAGAQELTMPSLITEEYFHRSGRIKAFGKSIFHLNDRYNKKYVLGPTHEELFTLAGTMKVQSYKDLPFNLYQIQTKFRDEMRPRYGLIRIREFVMKDAYTFDLDLNGLDIAYKKMDVAYRNIFDRLKLDYRIVTADTGTMGGLLSEEFQALTDIGEDTLVFCQKCDYASNIEVATCLTETVKSKEPLLDNVLVETPNAKTIEDITNLFKEDANKFIKTMIYKVDDKVYACLVRGSDDVNEIKVAKLLKGQTISLAEKEVVEEVTKCNIGFAGPIDLDIPIIVDNEVLNMVNFIVGANKTDYHYKNVNIKDFKYYLLADIRNIKEEDICPKCRGNLKFKKGIEVGNLFKLGTKYAEALDLYYLDKDNKRKPVVMGSYGIGLERCMASVIEQSHDEKGIIWPSIIAPYNVSIVVIDINDKKQMEVANNLYNDLTNLNIDVILDDRDERPGVKFNDMDLIGIPIRITVGKEIKNNRVELKLRNSEETKKINIEDVIDKIKH